MQTNEEERALGGPLPAANYAVVRYGREFLDRFATVLKALYFVNAVVGFIVILSALFIISNAVRLTLINLENAKDTIVVTDTGVENFTE